MSPPTFHGPVAKQLSAYFKKSDNRKHFGIDVSKAAQTEYARLMLEISSGDFNNQPEPHLASYRVYHHLQNWAGAMLENWLDLPPLAEFKALLKKAQARYSPNDPQSPVTPNFYWPWIMHDLKLNKESETFSSVLLTLGTEFGMNEDFLETFSFMMASRLGLYLQRRMGDGGINLLDPFAQSVYVCITATGYTGQYDELWLARFFPPLVEDAPMIIFHPPYVVADYVESDWKAFIHRAMLETRERDGNYAFFMLMKYGLGRSYWAEYVLGAYKGRNASGDAILLQGVPETKETGVP